MVFLAVSKFDPVTRKDWEKHLDSSQDPPSIEQLKVFLEEHEAMLDRSKIVMIKELCSKISFVSCRLVCHLLHKSKVLRYVLYVIIGKHNTLLHFENIPINSTGSASNNNNKVERSTNSGVKSDVNTLVVGI